ncbi:MAG: hypothetical protein ACYDDV_04065 [Methanoregula sp.]
MKELRFLLQVRRNGKTKNPSWDNYPGRAGSGHQSIPDFLGHSFTGNQGKIKTTNNKNNQSFYNYYEIIGGGQGKDEKKLQELHNYFSYNFGDTRCRVFDIDQPD